MSRLFDEMQEARRRGELAVPEGASGRPAVAVELVQFFPDASTALYECQRCGGLVTSARVDGHAQWHQDVGG